MREEIDRKIQEVNAEINKTHDSDMSVSEKMLRIDGLENMKIGLLIQSEDL